MVDQRAIFIPVHGVPEVIDEIRFISMERTADPNASSNLPAPSARVELWRGDLYGEPVDEIPMSLPISDGAKAVFPDRDRPIVVPGESLIARLYGCPTEWRILFKSRFHDRQGKAVERIVVLDNYGTRSEGANE